MRKTLLVFTTLVIALALPLNAALAASTTYTVQPGDSIAKIARSFGVSVDAIIEANALRNPSLIFPGQQLVIPDPTLSPGVGGTAAGDTGSGFTVDVGTPLYSADGYVVDIPITVHNQSVSPSIAGGKYTNIRKPDGLYEDVALMKSWHGAFEEPLPNEALSWQFQVTLSDGTTHLAIAGCRFTERVHAAGDEPLDRALDGRWLRWFHYEVDLDDGWFDCGNTYRINPGNIAPGTSGSSLLTVYLVNPHNRALTGAINGKPYPLRKVVKIVGTFFLPDGGVAGTRVINVP